MPYVDFIAFSAERGKQWQPDQGPRAPGSRVEPGLGQGRGKTGAWGISQPQAALKHKNQRAGVEGTDESRAEGLPVATGARPEQEAAAALGYSPR